jgi:hypothetical protein
MPGIELLREMNLSGRMNVSIEDARSIRNRPDVAIKPEAGDRSYWTKVSTDTFVLGSAIYGMTERSWLAIAGRLNQAEIGRMN